MKKLTYLFVILFSLAFLASCEKDKSIDMDIDALDMTKLKSKDIVVNIESSPMSGELTVSPYLIPGANNGGNRTCDEVALAFDGEFAMCGEKIDYEGGFMGAFPDGLEVTVTDGTYVTFDMEGCLEVDGMNVKIGAVIVKGSEQANVYYYPDGAMYDTGLAAPITSSGDPAGLSNLTFCFVPCVPNEPREIVIALKSYMENPVWSLENPYVRTPFSKSGGIVFPEEGYSIGYNVFVSGSQAEYPLWVMWGTEQIGTITVSDFMESGIHYLQVVLDTESDDWDFKGSFLYAGSLNGLKEYIDLYGEKYYYTYSSFPFYEGEVTGERIFIIPYSDITE